MVSIATPTTAPLEDPAHPIELEDDEIEEDGAAEAPGSSMYTLDRCLHSSHSIIALAEGKKKKKKKKPKKKKPEQSDPPRIGLSKFYPEGNYPVGEIQEYKDE
jgi:methionyl aminopeptidase